MDTEKYLSGFNLGYLIGVHQIDDDLTKQVRDILAKKPELPYSKGFSKGYFHGRSNISLNKKNSRIDELNQIENKDWEVER